MTHSTNYQNTFICVAPDTKARRGTEPKKKATLTVARATFEALVGRPYRLTSDQLLFEVFAARTGISKRCREESMKEFLKKARPCLRCSALGKSYGWGIHHDHESRVAIFGMESEEYREFVLGRSDSNRYHVSLVYAMRTRRREPDRT